MRSPSYSRQRSEMMTLLAWFMCSGLGLFLFVFGIGFDGPWAMGQGVDLSDFQRVKKWRGISTAS